MEEASGPLAPMDPEPPKVLRGKPVLYAEYLYKSNPKNVLQQRYFVVYKNKLEYYKISNITNINKIQPKGAIKFKHVLFYKLDVKEDINTSSLTLNCGSRNYVLSKIGRKIDYRYTFTNVKILQNIISTYQDYKFIKKKRSGLVSTGSEKGLRIHEAGDGKAPVYDSDSVLTQEQINLSPCTRVFVVARISDIKDNVFGLVFSNAGLTLIDPDTSTVKVHSSSFEVDAKNYLGFHDSIGDCRNLSFRSDEYTMRGISSLSGALPFPDIRVEKQARLALKNTYGAENALTSPLYVLIQCKYFFDNEGFDSRSEYLR